MKSGQSRIIILDAVLPNIGASAYQSLLDINMMPLAGIERTDRHWRELLQSVGLKVVTMEILEIGDGMIEVILEDDVRGTHN